MAGVAARLAGLGAAVFLGLWISGPGRARAQGMLDDEEEVEPELVQDPSTRVEIKAIRIQGNDLTDPGVIRHYLDLEEGQQITLADLDVALAEAKVRLTRVNYFYQVELYTLPPKDPLKRVVVVEVSEGYLWRFGGGNAYGRLGYENLGGLDRGLDVLLGAWPQEVHYFDRFVRGGEFRFTADVYHRDPVLASRLAADGRTYGLRVAGAQVRLDKWLGPDVALGIGIRGEYHHLEYDDGASASEERAPIAFQLLAELDYTDSVHHPTLGHLVRVTADAVLEPTGGPTHGTILVDLRKYWSPVEDLVFAGRLAAMSASASSPVEFDVDLASGLAVRSPQTLRLVGRDAVMASLEVRWLPLRFSIGPIGVHTELAGFVDAGLARRNLSDAESLDEKPPVVAAGPALRLHFPSPVFADFRFEYSFTNTPDGRRFFFTAERDF